MLPKVLDAAFDLLTKQEFADWYNGKFMDWVTASDAQSASDRLATGERLKKEFGRMIGLQTKLRQLLAE